MMVYMYKNNDRKNNVSHWGGKLNRMNKHIIKVIYISNIYIYILTPYCIRYINLVHLKHHVHIKQKEEEK